MLSRDQWPGSELKEFDEALKETAGYNLCVTFLIQPLILKDSLFIEHVTLKPEPLTFGPN